MTPIPAWLKAVADLSYQVGHTTLKPAKVNAIAEFWERIGPKMRHARKHPDDPKSQAWLAIGGLTPRESLPLLKWLPDPRVRRGRKAGLSDQTGALLAELEERVQRGEKPTTAARELLQARGVTDGLKAKADYLVHKKRRINSP